MPTRLPGPLLLDTTVDEEQSFRAEADVHDHTFSSRFLWVTPRAEHANPLLTRVGGAGNPVWRSLDALLSVPTGGRLRINLPAPAPGARGHLTVDDTRHDLLCAYDDSHDTESTDSCVDPINTYRYVHPSWMLDQPAHIRRLLHDLHKCRTQAPAETDSLAPDADPRRRPRLSSLNTEELAHAAAPLLGLPAAIAEAIAVAVGAHALAPRLDEVLDLARALQAS